MNVADVQKDLISEIRLDPLEARVFLLVTMGGKMTIHDIASRLEIDIDAASSACLNLTGLGGFIEMSPTEFEAMHPRFTAVNMYKRMCEREGIKFGRNKTVDGIGALLERHYDHARTK